MHDYFEHGRVLIVALSRWMVIIDIAGYQSEVAVVILIGQSNLFISLME